MNSHQTNHFPGGLVWPPVDKKGGIPIGQSQPPVNIRPERPDVCPAPAGKSSTITAKLRLDTSEFRQAMDALRGIKLPRLPWRVRLAVWWAGVQARRKMGSAEAVLERRLARRKEQVVHLKAVVARLADQVMDLNGRLARERMKHVFAECRCRRLEKERDEAVMVCQWRADTVARLRAGIADLGRREESSNLQEPRSKEAPSTNGDVDDDPENPLPFHAEDVVNLKVCPRCGPWEKSFNVSGVNCKRCGKWLHRLGWEGPWAN